MAQKRNYRGKKLSILKNKTAMDKNLDINVESSREMDSRECMVDDKTVLLICDKSAKKVGVVTGDGLDEENASLNWLVNLSAASIFPSTAHSDASRNCSDDHHLHNAGVNTKPALTYTELIEKALKEKGELTVSEIYKWIYCKYPYYKKNDGRWKNSIRHNLSINPQFRKGDKCNNGGHYWTLNREYDDQFKKWELRKGTREDRKRKAAELKDEEETERATRSISLAAEFNGTEYGESYSSSKSTSDKYPTIGTNDPSLVRVATDILNGIDRQVEVEFMNKNTETIAAPLVIDEDIFESSDPILTDPLLFSDCLELGFQPYELIDSRL